MALPLVAFAARMGISHVTKYVAKTAARKALTRGAVAKATKVLAKIPRPTAITRALRAKVGIPMAPAAKAAAAAGGIRGALVKTGVAAIERPFRTMLPYAATAGMLGAVSRIGEEKGLTAAERGGLVGEVITGGAIVPSGLPSGLGVGRMPRTVGEVPIMEPTIVRSWTTGTTDFAVDSTGKHWVLTKSGWKKYSPKKPIVLGTKHLTPKKFIAAAKKYYGLKKDLDKVFKVVRKKK